MFTFITSIRHPKNSLYYERVWDLLRDTLVSVCSQTCDKFNVIIVCNEVLDDFSDIPIIRNANVQFVTVDLDPPSTAEGPVTGVPACNIDRGLKFVIGLIAARKHNPEYIMFVDADDFISRNIVKHALDNPGEMGWYFERGIYIQDFQITYRLNFRQTCGTSHILNYNTLVQDIDFNKLSVSSTKSDILNHVHPFFVKGVLGCHMNYETYFFNCYYHLNKWPLVDSAAYNMGTGENHSGKDSGCGPGWFPLRKPSAKLDRHVYDLKPPLIDHKNKYLPVHTGDDWCISAIKDCGVYNPVELSAKELKNIYGYETCNEYNSFTFVRNPWDRLVSIYTSGYVDRGLGETFEDFVKSSKIPSQSSQLLPWVKNIFKLEQPTDYSKFLDKEVYVYPPATTSSHYSAYYSKSLREFVSEKYKDDITAFDYTFEEVYPTEDIPRFTTNRKAPAILSAIIMPRIEVFFLEEWIDHHLSLGFDKVLLYDNGVKSVDNSVWSEGARPLEDNESYKWTKKPDIPYFEEYSDLQIYDKLNEIVAKYEGTVELIPWAFGIDHEREYPFSQWDTIRDSVQRYTNAWFYFSDPDEYLVLRLHKTVHDLIEQHPTVTAFQFGQRIFDSRKANTPVREIYNWGYDNPMHKNLVYSDIDHDDEDLTVHVQNIRYGDYYRLPKSIGVYHHYRGDANVVGGTAIRTLGSEPVETVKFENVDYSMKNYLL